MKIKKILNILFSLIAVIFFIIILFKIDINSLNIFYNQLNLWIWIIIFIGFLISYVAKTLRFMMLNTLSFKDMFNATIYQNFFLFILPFRLGELVYIKKLSKLGIKKIKSATDIMVVRLYDIFVLSLLAFSIILVMNNLRLGKSLIIPLILIILSLFFISYAMKIIKLIKTTTINNNFFIRKNLNELSNIFLKISSLSKIRLLLITILIWILGFIPWIIILSIIFDFNMFQILLVISIPLFSTFIPINPPAGAGVINGAWIFGLVLVGIDLNYAINFSLFAHAIYLIQITLIFSGLFLYNQVKKK